MVSWTWLKWKPYALWKTWREREYKPKTEKKYLQKTYLMKDYYSKYTYNSTIWNNSILNGQKIWTDTSQKKMANKQVKRCLASYVTGELQIQVRHHDMPMRRARVHNTDTTKGRQPHDFTHVWDIKLKLIDTDRKQKGGYQREGDGGL